MKKTFGIFMAAALVCLAPAFLASCANSSDSALPLLSAGGGSPSTSGGTNETGSGGTGGGNENGGQNGGQQTGGGQQQQAQTKYYSKTLKMGEFACLFTITNKEVASYEFISGSDVVRIDNNVKNAKYYGYIYTLKEGTAQIKFTGSDDAATNPNDGCIYVVTITVESAQSGGSSGGQAESIEPQFYGTWKFTNTAFGKTVVATLILNSDKNGSLKVIGDGTEMSSASFAWSARTSGGTKYIKFSNVSPQVTQFGFDGDHQVTGMTSSQFTMHGTYGFYIPSTTDWHKQ